MTEPNATVATPAPADRGFWPPPVKHPLLVALIVLKGSLVVLAVLRAWELPPFRTSVQVTDNAYVRGRTTVIAPQVSGYVVAVDAADFANVGKGQALVRIDDRQYRAKVDQARAALEAQKTTLANLDQVHAARVAALAAQAAAILDAKAQLLRSKSDLERVAELVRDGSVSVRELDQARAALAHTRAQLDQAQAAYEIAQQDLRAVAVNRAGLEFQIDGAAAQWRAAGIDLENTVVRAPEGGRLGEIGVRLGQYVTSGTQLLALVPDDRWVTANFKETQTGGMRPGLRAWITVDALNGRRIEGHVDDIAPAAASELSAVKPDSGTGNFVKIPQRIGVRLRLDGTAEALRSLRPGMSVEAHVDTGGAR